MRLLIQKVNEATVLVSRKVVGNINKGLLIFQGVDQADTHDDITWLVKKVINLRIFNDSNTDFATLVDPLGAVVLRVNDGGRRGPATRL